MKRISLTPASSSTAEISTLCPSLWMNCAMASRTSGINPLGDVAARQVDVLFGRDFDPALGLALDRLFHLRGRARGQYVIGNLHAFADDAARGDQRAFTDHAPVEQNGVAADERVPLHVAIFHHGGMTDRYVVVDARELRDVNDGVVLNRGARADANRSV